MTAQLIGLDKVFKSLNEEIARIEGATLAGLYAGGLKIQYLAQKRVPVEDGILRNSAYTVIVNDQIEVGFNAPYAIYVHENMEQKLKGQPRSSGKGVYWGPAGQPKFLESAANDLKEEVLRTVAAHAGSL